MPRPFLFLNTQLLIISTVFFSSCGFGLQLDCDAEEAGLKELAQTRYGTAAAASPLDCGLLPIEAFEESCFIKAVKSSDVGLVCSLMDDARMLFNIHFYGGYGLRMAVRAGQVDLVEVLAQDRRINPNTQDREGYTALSIAACRGRADLLRLLLQNKHADPNLATKDNATPLSIAVAKDQAEIVQLLLQNESTDPHVRYPGGFNTLIKAAFYYHVAVVRVLLQDRRVNPDIVSKDGHTALNIATVFDCTEVKNLLHTVSKQR